ncbi:winged helix-turn-helix transcriptional regulator [Bifidobacterium sp. 64T4]|uniref:MarR family winged helix-turn-helix transcriptional regulator n=1 Tax=Bifidobacterium pongonis TaxID=2834432 RepID=UPI001C57E7DE|nr:MarR family winged helix-turn-helix transcriptional regulator [Bifidobacterium pongonis]MBW3094516.1 winged helix-turn-helix transcriptional regulator [Bifidobacterium pongonis]
MESISIEQLHPIDELYTLGLRLDKIYSALAKRYDETYFSLGVLEELKDHPEGMTQKQLCTALYMPKQTASSVISSLGRRGLVETSASPADKRSKVHTLTSRGLGIAVRAGAEERQAEEHCMTEVGVQNIAAMIDTMHRLVDHLEQTLGSTVVTDPISVPVDDLTAGSTEAKA